jgi:hypothetical protein
MRALLGKLGPITEPFLHVVPVFLLIFAAILIALPQTANAQIWVTSGFQSAAAGPGGQQNEIAYCTTSAVDPATGQLSPAGAGYGGFMAGYGSFDASCSVTPSTGAEITSAQCPGNPLTYPAGSAAGGNPTGECTVAFQPQPGITYTVNSRHYIVFKVSPTVTSCGGFGPTLCYLDPLGYYSFTYSPNPGPNGYWPPTPVFQGTNTLNIVDVTCTERGGVCASQFFPDEYCLAGTTAFGVSFCTSYIEEPDIYLLAKTSAVFAACPTPAIASVTPDTWKAGKTYNITLTGTGFIPPASATAACPVSPVKVTEPNGTVTVSGVTVASATQITASVTPAASDPTGQATITVGSAPNTATTTAQIDGCAVPSIASVVPSTWFAGRSYEKVVIAGTGFTTQDKATDACPATPVTIAAADGSAVPVSNVKVDSKTRITLAVKPDDSEPTQLATITAGTAPNVGSFNTAQILGNQIKCDPSTNCTQSVISTTDGSSPPLQKVVVGQQIALISNPDLPTAIKPTSSTWTVGGNRIADYKPTSGPTQVTPLDEKDLKNANVNFYWADSNDNNSVPVTYKYCADIPGVGNQCSSVAIAAFTVMGPDSVNVYTCGGAVGGDGCTSRGRLGTVEIIPRPDVGPGTFLSFGGTGGTNLGIVFTASDASSSPPGQYSFAQLINDYNWTYSYTSGEPCSAGESVGLDRIYPYPMDTATTADDNPAVKLFLDDTEVRTSFNATMYILWTPSDVVKAIPVPLGSVNWEWSGEAAQEPKTETLSVKGRSSKGNAAKFKKSSVFPRWDGLAKVTGPDCFR